jgi:16S rRNA (cytidine1402-2'-O)-methyltransferase
MVPAMPDTTKDSPIFSSPLPGLYIVATPIGNLGDITLRAIETLRGVALIAAEDKRVTAKLLNHLNIKAPLVAYNDHSDERVRADLVARMATEAIALVSDAGTPLISDPGYKLVRAARAAGRPVTTLPGPCAAIAAMTLSGLPTDRFLFAGFLPSKAKARADAIADLAAIRASLILYESGPRLSATLAALADGLGDREAAVAREISKLFEETVTGRLRTLAARYADTPPKGEIVIIIAPPEGAVAPVADAGAIDAALMAAMATLPVAKAAKQVAASLGIDRHDAYRRAVALKP